MANKLHPFSSVTTAEIKQTSEILSNLYPETTLTYQSITLHEPDKGLMLKYLEAEHCGHAARPSIDRQIFVNFYRKNHGRLNEAVINLSKETVVYNKQLGSNCHGTGDHDEVIRVEEFVKLDPKVRTELERMGVDPSQLVCDPWPYGSDGICDEPRQYQCLLYMRHPASQSDENCNHYSCPLPFSVVVDPVKWEVTRIELLPTGPADTLTAHQSYQVPSPNEYAPRFQQLRKDLKPLHVVQPEGVSFSIVEDFESSHVVSWQKWQFRLGFNGREGMILYDVRYNSRALFYRISLSEINIPYADPRHPYHKKSAFDLGDVGAGYSANNLRLGCDCLGSIHYCSAILSGPSGDVIEKPNCICIHEQDTGIGWKHSNYRTNTAVVTRGRELVVQSVLTVANYEYILAFVFNQAGDIKYEVKPSGILSTQPIDEGLSVEWGTVVHPGVLAAHHQHIFSLRLDPMIDGPTNSLVYDETCAMDRADPLNRHGTGYTTKQTVVQYAGGYDLNLQNGRSYRIQNSSSMNPVNNKAVGYRIVVPDFQKLLAARDTLNFRRGEFTDHNIYVTRYKPGQYYAAGQYTNQSRGGDGVRTWASSAEPVVDEDIVVWVQFGMNHVTRIEDFPIMSGDVMEVRLRPDNFFERNPAVDVPPSTQEVNKSCHVETTSESGESAARGLA